MRYITIFLTTFLFGKIAAQTELPFLGQTTYPEGVVLNDIWGWHDETTDAEYALVGMTTGLSIVDVTDPTTPEKLHFIDGPQSTWRDIKTYGHFAYTVTEAEAGLLVTDLSQLPDSITYNYTTLGAELSTAHNIWIDEFGFAYVVGYNNVGDSLASAEKGALILDLNADPWEPPIVGMSNEKYFHDVYVRDNIMYSSDINEGTFSIWDVSDKSNIQFIANKTTPNEFTHNAWLSDNSEYLFTTDERADGGVASYNVSDVSDISEAHLYKSSLGTAKIPHNAHVFNDWIVVSYYTDGIRVLDANNPEILVETAYYDTSPLDNSGFGGCWGAYPFLPSGNILASDRQEGLFVLGSDYQRSAYLEGTVTVENSTQTLNAVNVSIQETNSKVQTNSMGRYKTGTSFEGESAQFDVTFELFGYYPLTITDVTLTKEEVFTLDAELTPKPEVEPVIVFQDAVTGEVIDQVYSTLEHSIPIVPFSYYESQAYSVESGEASFESVPIEETLGLRSHRWGYRIVNTEIELLDDSPIVIDMEPGYYDEFFYEEGGEQVDTLWTVITYGDAEENGDWTFVEYVPGLNLYWPNTDSQDDFGDGCFSTGRNEGMTNGIILDTTTLVSPMMDLSTYGSPILAFDAFMHTTNNAWVPERGSLIIEITDGENTTFLKSFPDTSNQIFDQWQYNEIVLSDFVTPTDNMQVLFTLYSDTEEYFYLDASVDRFEIIEGDPSFIPNDPNNDIAVYPNPSSDEFTLDLQRLEGEVSISVFDLQSREIAQYEVLAGANFTFGSSLHAGMYVIKVNDDSGTSRSLKLVKNR